MYGLLGKTLKHSFSKSIHEALSPITYEFFEKDEEQMKAFMMEKNFAGINVTIPYKEAVIPYLDFVDERAKRIHAVNTIVNRDGKLYGYNTDYDGICYLIEKNNVCVEGKTVAILGTGGTSNTATCVMEDYHAKRIIHVSRTKKEATITYEELYEIAQSIDIIVNTTPLGMYPNVEGCAVDISKFTSCICVIDVIFNPLQTKLLQEAKHFGIQAIGGLDMLIVQGIKAHEYFMNRSIDASKTEELIKKLTLEKQNIVLIGMPTCGKSTIGKELANQLNYTFIDIDEEIEKREGNEIKTIFATQGEEYFRNIEEIVTKEICLRNHQIICTGGGVIKRKNNIQSLHYNGLVLFIDRNVDLLFSTSSRPLSSSKEAIQKLYEERYDTYVDACDIRIDNNASIAEALNSIKEILL